MSRSRYPKITRREDGTKGCRGCGADIPKGRRTWCSTECFQNNFWPHVKHKVFERDGFKCMLCKFDFAASNKTYDEWQWSHDRKWSERPPHPKPEFDHIIPFSEGGPHHPDNVRTLCHGCHVKVTTEWRRSKKMAEAR